MTLSKKWLARLSELEKYKKEDGTVLVTGNANEALRNWFNKQKAIYRKGYLVPEKIQALKDTGVDLARKNRSWDDSFELLLKFKEENGHTNITKSSSEDTSLYDFVHRVRKDYRKPNFSEEKTEKLNNIGFKFTPEKDKFEEYFNKLVNYKNKNGNTNVPKNLALSYIDRYDINRII